MNSKAFTRALTTLAATLIATTGAFAHGNDGHDGKPRKWDARQFQFASLLPSHFEAGMVGKVTVK